MHPNGGRFVDLVTADPFEQFGQGHELPAFEQLNPPVIAAWEALPASDSLKAKLAEGFVEIGEDGAFTLRPGQGER